jgi:putative RNA-directed DNA polymerase
MPKRVGYLYDKMVDRDFIRAVIQEAAKGRRSRKDIAPVLADLDGYVEKTYELVATESFVPSEPKIREIYDESSEKHRKIKMVPFWPDGVIQWMLVTAMKPVLMRGMHPWSCASIPGRGGKRIHKKIRGALRNDPKGTKYAAELDVAQYYPSISGKRLIWALARKIKDKRFLRTVYSIIESCGGGLAIGYYICQWLANYYLESLDQYIMTLPGVKYMTRYMDNITLLGPNKKQLHKARKLIAAFMQQRLGLAMKANWQIYPTAKRMVSAVGYRFSRTHVILRKRNFLRFTRQCRRVKKRLDAGKPIAFAQASGLLSRIGQLRHCNSQKIREKYVDPIGVRNLKEVVRHESKRRQCAQQRLCAGGAA